MKRMCVALVFIGWISISPVAHAQELRYPVRHDHILRSCSGELIFGADTVEYKAKDPENTRVWRYEDIQQIGLLGPKSISILSYEDSKWKLGKDHIYRFEVTDGEISASLWTMLQTKVTRPLVSAVIPADISGRFAIPVKHLRGFGGTNGKLEIGEEYIVYSTTKAKDSRIWRYEDISSIGSTGPYQLRVTSFDRAEGERGGERNFVFTLKQKLLPETYDFIWWKINGPQIAPAAKK